MSSDEEMRSSPSTDGDRTPPPIQSQQLAPSLNLPMGFGSASLEAPYLSFSASDFPTFPSSSSALMSDKANAFEDTSSSSSTSSSQRDSLRTRMTDHDHDDDNDNDNSPQTPPSPQSTKGKDTYSEEETHEEEEYDEEEGDGEDEEELDYQKLLLDLQKTDRIMDPNVVTGLGKFIKAHGTPTVLFSCILSSPLSI